MSLLEELIIYFPGIEFRDNQERFGKNVFYKGKVAYLEDTLLYYSYKGVKSKRNKKKKSSVVSLIRNSFK